LVALLAGAGLTHFLVPAPYDAIVPRALPGKPRTWTLLSGAAEMAVAAAVANPGTRRAAALTAAGLFVVVFPANVKMARDWRDKPAPLRWAGFLRLPLQAPLIAWAVQVSRDAE
jgi:uncharacterized membrane protein